MPPDDKRERVAKIQGLAVLASVFIGMAMMATIAYVKGRGWEGDFGVYTTKTPRLLFLLQFSLGSLLTSVDDFVPRAAMATESARF